MTSVLWPNGTPNIPHVTSEYGPRVAPVTGASTFHRGIDLSGFPINKSPVDGVVTFAGNGGSGGIMVVITAGNGDTFMLAHNARLLVNQGQRILAGQDVGVQGMTGVASGVHCHFEIRPGGGPTINPRDYMGRANPASDNHQLITGMDIEMPRYIRNMDTGTIAIGTLGVFHVELTSYAYVTLLDGWKLWDRSQDLHLPGNVYDFVKSWVPAGGGTIDPTLAAKLDALTAAINADDTPNSDLTEDDLNRIAKAVNDDAAARLKS